jgi:hypothetical protein
MAATPVTAVNVSTQKVDLEAAYQALIDGMNAKLVGIDSFILNKQTIARTALVALFQQRIQAARTVKANRAVLQQSVADERAIDATVKPLRASVKTFLQARYGKTSPEMQAFGFTQSRKPKASAQAKAGAVTKAKATRQARGTKGAQQKKAIKAPAPAPVATVSTTSTPAAPGTGGAGSSGGASGTRT